MCYEAIGTIFVLSVRLCYAIDGYAQSTYFTLELNNKTVKEVFKAIEKNSEYVVFYYDGVVDVNRKVTIQAENKTVDQILDDFLPEPPISMKSKTGKS